MLRIEFNSPELSPVPMANNGVVHAKVTDLAKKRRAFAAVFKKPDAARSGWFGIFFPGRSL